MKITLFQCLCHLGIQTTTLQTACVLSNCWDLTEYSDLASLPSSSEVSLKLHHPHLSYLHPWLENCVLLPSCCQALAIAFCHRRHNVVMLFNVTIWECNARRARQFRDNVSMKPHLKPTK